MNPNDRKTMHVSLPPLNKGIYIVMARTNDGHAPDRARLNLSGWQLKRPRRSDIAMDDPFIWVRAIHFAATILVAGTLWFGAFIAEPAFRKVDHSTKPVAVAIANVRVRLRWLAWLCLTVALISGVASLLFVACANGRSAVGGCLRPIRAFRAS